MDAATILATLVSGSVIGLILGLVGGGGSILAVPLLIYVVGVGSPHAAIGTAAVAVTVNALASLIGHARAGRRRFKRVGLSKRKGTAKTEKAAILAARTLIETALAMKGPKRRQATSCIRATSSGKMRR